MQELGIDAPHQFLFPGKFGRTQENNMTLELALPSLSRGNISPFREMGAYEALWDKKGASFKTISQALIKSNSLPSELIENSVAERYGEEAKSVILKAKINRFEVSVAGMRGYPDKLKDADHHVGLLYYRGRWDLLYTRCVSVVGTRVPSPEGLGRTRKLVKALVKDHFTIVSGLAKGIDRAAHGAAIDAEGQTIAVIGTPIHYAYPAENRTLQEQIARDHLLISQVPIIRWHKQHPKQNRIFFPERNIIMSALTEATIIVEAGETSGTLIQARHAMRQGRKLFILESCFHNKSITWPQRFLEAGAIRVQEYSDIIRHLHV